MTKRATIAALLLCAAPLAAQEPPPPPPDSLPSPADSAQMEMARLADTTSESRADSVITPAPSQPLGVDAEVRMALFELMGDEWVAALGRLEWLRDSPVAFTETGSAELHGRRDLLFLLAQAYYRLGMSDRFRATAEALGSGASTGDRYAGVIQPQLLLDAYRRGDYERALQIAGSITAGDASPEIRGLAMLVSGLTSYQMGRYPQARASFATARQGGGPYAGYAQYMDALALLRADTSQAAAALAALQSLAQGAGGEFADQVRLTAAQLAYEAERYPESAALAEAIAPASGLASQALLTRAWALYKADQVEAAGAAFAEFATRYPQLPEQEETALMSAQVLLQLGRTTEAQQIFERVADSASAQAGSLGARARAGMADAARALVGARAAGLLYLTEPASGKSLALDESAGSGAGVLAAAFGDSATTATIPNVDAVDIVSLDDISARLDAIAPGGAVATATFPRRIVFVSATSGSSGSEYARQAQQLYAADVAVALARHRLGAALTALAMRIATLERLQEMATAQNAAFDQTAATLALAQDSLGRLSARLDVVGTRLRQIFGAQADVTRLLATENSAMIDSIRTAMAGSLGESERTVLNLEAQTATIYNNLATFIETNLDRAIAGHPVLALADSVRAHSDSLRALLAETRQVVASTTEQLAAELARLRAGEPEEVRSMRSALAAAESQRASVEGSVVALVSAELDARAGRMVADLKRDAEAAEFGSASAAFFQAIDAGDATTPAGSGSTSGQRERASGAAPLAGTASAEVSSPRSDSRSP